MATAKEKENKTEEIIETVPAVPAVEKTVTIRVPREGKDEEDKVVWVNNRRFIIKRGVAVEVPECVAEVLKEEENMLEYIYEFESKTQK